MTNDWPIITSGADYFRQAEKRAMRAERRPNPLSAADLLGPGMSAKAVHITDWNAEEAQFNGFFYGSAGIPHSPVVTVQDFDEAGLPVGAPYVEAPVAWTGVVIGRADNSGTQQVWDPENPDGQRQFFRTWSPDPADEELVIWTEWRRFATPSGNIDVTVMDPPLLGTINDAYQNAVDALEDAEEAFNFAQAQTKVYRQPEPPTGTPEVPLKENDVWFDTDDGNKPHIYVGGVWVFNIASWLATTNGKLVVTPQGMIAYNVDDDVTFFLNASDGSIVMSGSLSSALDINGATVTGGVVQTDVAPDTGIKMNNLGFAAYNTLGDPTFTITAETGAVAMLGDLLSGSTVTGAIITGGTLRTATSTGNPNRIEVKQVSGVGRVEGWSGDSNHTLYPGLVTFGTQNSGTLLSTKTNLTSGRPDSASQEVSIELRSWTPSGVEGAVRMLGRVEVTGALEVSGDLYGGSSNSLHFNQIQTYDADDIVVSDDLEMSGRTIKGGVSLAGGPDITGGLTVDGTVDLNDLGGSGGASYVLVGNSGVLQRGEPFDTGAADSGGEGFRVLRVPN